MKKKQAFSSVGPSGEIAGAKVGDRVGGGVGSEIYGPKSILYLIDLAVVESPIHWEVG